MCHMCTVLIWTPSNCVHVVWCVIMPAHTAHSFTHKGTFSEMSWLYVQIMRSTGPAERGSVTRLIADCFPSPGLAVAHRVWSLPSLSTGIRRINLWTSVEIFSATTIWDSLRSSAFHEALWLTVQMLTDGFWCVSDTHWRLSGLTHLVTLKYFPGYS